MHWGNLPLSLCFRLKLDPDLERMPTLGPAHVGEKSTKGQVGRLPKAGPCSPVSVWVTERAVFFTNGFHFWNGHIF